MKYIHSLYIGLLSLLFVGCTDEIENSSYGQGEGRLVLSGIKLEAVVGEVTTKAALEEDILPEITDFTIEIVDSEGSPVKTLEPGTLQCSLSTGSYKLKAIYGDAEAPSTTPAFYGETDFTIIEGGVSTPTITASLIQAVLHPIVTEELVAQFKDYKLTIKQTDGEAVDMVNDKDFFIPSDGTYTLTLSGTNQLGESFSHDWQYGNLAVRTRYTVECNPDLPSFTMPEQPEENVWSKFIYITPMTADNMTSHSEMAQKVIDNVVYEASADGITWNSSEIKDGKIVITGLEASTKYTLRSRFGAVYSVNIVEVTTESAQQIENGDMESWSNESYATYGQKTIYLYYAGTSSTDKSWGTRNPLTMAGVNEGTSAGTSNQITAYRWNSCTIPTTDAVSGNAAEIRTMALATIPIKGTEVGTGWFWSNNNVENVVRNNHRIYYGYLYTGESDVTSFNETPSEYGIPQSDRPLSISFNYKYSPYNDDNCLIYAKLYDANKNEIASTEVFKSNEYQDSYKIVTLNFQYSNFNTKVASIFVMFQSGEKETWDYVTYLSGDYKANPWSLDTFVGSVLKIDNITLNYDYE